VLDDILYETHESIDSDLKQKNLKI